jgi:hypothetical protein
MVFVMQLHSMWPQKKVSTISFLSFLCFERVFWQPSGFHVRPERNRDHARKQWTWPVAKKYSGIHRFCLIMATVHDLFGGFVGTVVVEQVVYIYIYLYILRLGFSGTKRQKRGLLSILYIYDV